MNSYKFSLFAIACFAMVPSPFAWSNGINPPQPNIGPVTAVCTARADGRRQEFLRASIINDDGTGETIAFQHGTVYERIALSALQTIALTSAKSDLDGYAAASWRRANSDHEETGMVRIRSKVRTFGLAGFTSAAKRVSIDLSACKAIEFAPLGGGAGAVAPSRFPPPVELQVFFDPRQSNLTVDAIAAIDREIDKIRASTQNEQSALVLVTAHADPVEVGSQAASQHLSERRADAARAYLVSKGIPVDAIETLGMGKTQPVEGLVCRQTDTRQLSACHQPNRRVEIEVKRQVTKR